MTSIEWLIEKIGIINTDDPYYKDIVQQAKEMHKEEMNGAYEDGWFSCEKKLLDNENTRI